MMTRRQVISLSPRAAATPARERVAEFVELDHVFEALDAIAAKRAPSRREWMAAIRSPRGSK
jgi:hypothetical protein